MNITGLSHWICCERTGMQWNKQIYFFYLLLSCAQTDGGHAEFALNVLWLTNAKPIML